MLALNLINHLLEQNPKVSQELSGFNGLVVSIQTAHFDILGKINELGLLEHSTRPADTILIIHAQALPKILQGELPNFNDLAIEGDMELGMNLMWCLAKIRYSPYHDLSRLLGEEKALQLSEKAQKIGQIFQMIGQSVIFQGVNVMQHTQKHQSEQDELKEHLNQCLDEMHYLRQELERVNRRVRELEASQEDSYH